MVETKEETIKSLDEKEKAKPFWQSLPPIVIIIGAVVAFLAFKSMFMDKTGGQQQFFLILLVIGFIYLISQTKTTTPIPVSPKEAEILVERECTRKKIWNQVPLMSKFVVGPVSDMLHRDARGLYYNVAVKLINPFHKTDYFIGKVMASGKERAFTTLIKSIGPITGRKIEQETDVTKVPDWVKRPKQYPILDRLWGLNK